MRPFLTAAMAIFLLASCTDSDSFFADDKAYKRTVLKDYKHRVELLNGYDATAIVEDQRLSPREKEMLQFLYAYMPMGDMINYPVEYYLEHVRLSEEAREFFSWGKDIPDIIYRHFVVPIRVNNEDIDYSREVFMNELKSRVKDLPIKEAILEVNHWCHEKVVYTPTDSRTRSPLSLVSSGAGRCGEESTFLVTALRSVGIPARQVYTPRWAHTDDNHAWVEAWADGEWYFLGACEPEPVLNLGWFNSSASRAMLMHTNVFGRYNGPEDVMCRTELVTEINITENYAPVASLEVQVVDNQGKPVKGAEVEFKIYNYSEFYSIARKTSDAKGTTSIVAGCGDALVWASKNGNYGFQLASLGDDEKITVVLEHKSGDNFSSEFYVVPPVESGELPYVSEEQRVENTRRMAQEDSIRNAYTGTFYTEETAKLFARENGLDEQVTSMLLPLAKGNHAVIKTFLLEAREIGELEKALVLLKSVREKDLSDTPKDVLEDHLHNTESSDPRVLNPRVRMELLSAYRAFLQQNIDKELAETFVQDPQNLVSWCRENLNMTDAYALPLVPIRPEGTWKFKVSDSRSRDLFFVAVCRSLEIPAWIDEVSGKLRYQHDWQEYDVDFEAPKPLSNAYGQVVLNYIPNKEVPVPRYSIHFTLSRIENGKLKLMNFDEGGPVEELFTQGARLEAGDYALVSGIRLDQGEVLSQMTVFTIPEDDTVRVDLVFPEKKDATSVLGVADLNAEYSVEGKTASLKDFIGDEKCIVAILGAGEEPTNHVLNDISLFKEEFENYGVKLLFLFENEENLQAFRPQDFPNLPSKVSTAIDQNSEVKQALLKGANSSKEELPIVTVVNAKGELSFFSSGYMIGIGERLLREFR